MKSNKLLPFLLVLVALSLSQKANSGLVIAQSDLGNLDTAGPESIGNNQLSAQSLVPLFNIGDTYLLSWKIVVEKVTLSGTMSFARDETTDQSSASWEAQLNSSSAPTTVTDSGECIDSSGIACNPYLDMPTPYEILFGDLSTVIGPGTYAVNAFGDLYFTNLFNTTNLSSSRTLTVYARSEYTYCFNDADTNCAEEYQTAIYVPVDNGNGGDGRVPIPSTIALIGFGLSSLLLSRRRRV